MFKDAVQGFKPYRFPPVVLTRSQRLSQAGATTLAGCNTVGDYSVIMHAVC